MKVIGCRIHLAGSASKETSESLLRYAHELVTELVRSLGEAGATFVLGVGKEPLVRPDDATSPSIIFDWTALSTLQELLKAGRAEAVGPEGRLISTIATTKTDTQIPEARRTIWRDLLTADAVKPEYPTPGWTAGAVRRQRQAQQGDVLIALSGGQGVEHLAELYALSGKPVIPLDLDLGSSANDGSGGATRLAQKALEHPERFVRLADPGAAAGLLTRVSTRGGREDISEVVTAISDLIRALAPPSAFYVRLLNDSYEDYDSVERFFRGVVDPAVDQLGYRPISMGRNSNEYAWINEAIFDSLHHSAVAIVDLTGLRNNCLMEYGYALGRAQRVILTARKGTLLLFDTQAIDCHMWEDDVEDTERIAQFQEYWRRNIDRPPLVKPRELL